MDIPGDLQELHALLGERAGRGRADRLPGEILLSLVDKGPTDGRVLARGRRGPQVVLALRALEAEGLAVSGVQDGVVFYAPTERAERVIVSLRRLDQRPPAANRRGVG